MLEHLDHLAETAAQAISNIKFDKVVVWDGAGGGGEGGGSSTSRFLQSLAGSLPPTLAMMRDIGGVEMPEFLGKLVADESEQTDSDEAALTAGVDEGEDEAPVASTES